MSKSNTKYKHKPTHDLLRVPYTFFEFLPVNTQIMYRLLRAHVDKYARCDIKHRTITYSRWCCDARTYVNCTMTSEEAHRIVTELYDG